MTPESALLAGFLAGLFGSPHCVAMCGGIMGFLHSQLPRGRGVLGLGFHAGRLTSYLVLGLAVTSLGLLPQALLPAAAPPAMRVALGAVLVLIGLYIALPGRIRDFAGAAAAPITRRMMPVLGRMLPADTWDRAIGLGLLWGLLPCGLLYTVLGAAWLLADPGATLALVLGFGLGTVPLLLGGGVAVARLRWRIQAAAFRLPAATLLAATGLLVAIGPWLASAWHHPAIEFLVDCVTPAPV